MFYDAHVLAWYDYVAWCECGTYAWWRIDEGY
jgi:hypothetical protein